MEYSQINDFLYIGSSPRNNADITQLAEIGIKCVLNLQSDDDLAYYGLNADELKRNYERLNIVFRRLPVNDYEPANLESNLSAGIDMILELLNYGTIYLHCNAGVNRSPTLAIAFLARHTGSSVKDAISLVTSRRNCEPYYRILGL